MSIITSAPQDLVKNMQFMVNQTRTMYAGWLHLNKAQTVSLTTLFKPGDFGLLCARIMSAKLRRGTNYTMGAKEDGTEQGPVL
jgi:hypothetical protein